MERENRLRIYRLRDGYAEFLHNADPRVQFNKHERRPYVGVVLQIGPHSYFVPMESPKPNHAKIKSGVHIMRMKGGEYGLLGFNNMVPAKKHYLIEVDISTEPDAKYRELLKNQFVFCNEHRAEILDHALKTYIRATEKKDPFFVKICCDFKKLEAVYTRYFFKTTIE